MNLLERLRSTLGVDLVRITLYLQCGRCNRVWQINVRGEEALPAGWQICRACGHRPEPKVVNGGAQ